MVSPTPGAPALCDANCLLLPPRSPHQWDFVCGRPSPAAQRQMVLLAWGCAELGENRGLVSVLGLAVDLLLAVP